MDTRVDRTIEKALVASTSHVSFNDKEHFLPDNACDAHDLIVYDIDYGWLVYTGKDSRMDVSRASEGLRKLVEIAQAEGCLWIKLDADGTVYDDVPKYDW